MSYGSVSGIASLVPRWARATGGTFDTTTRPTLTDVAAWLEQVSAVMDIMLATEGFAIPITTPATVVATLDLFVNQEVASMCDGVNSSGRFGPLPSKGGTFQREIITGDIKKFIEDFAAGLALAGASRTLTTGSQIGYRGTDNAGNATAPIFQRTGFGNVFEDWDNA